jgi:hypothetical protein
LESFIPGRHCKPTTRGRLLYWYPYSMSLLKKIMHHGKRISVCIKFIIGVWSVKIPTCLHLKWIDIYSYLLKSI